MHISILPRWHFFTCRWLVWLNCTFDSSRSHIRICILTLKYSYMIIRKWMICFCVLLFSTFEFGLDYFSQNTNFLYIFICNFSILKTVTVINNKFFYAKLLPLASLLVKSLKHRGGGGGGGGVGRGEWLSLSRQNSAEFLFIKSPL